MLGMQGSEDVCCGLPQLPIAPLDCPSLPAWTRIEVTRSGDVQKPGGPGLTVGVLCLLLHLSVLCVLTAEKAQLAGISSGTQGHLLSKGLRADVASRPSYPQGVKAGRAQEQTVPNFHGAGTISRRPA